MLRPDFCRVPCLNGFSALSVGFACSHSESAKHFKTVLCYKWIKLLNRIKNKSWVRRQVMCVESCKAGTNPGSLSNAVLSFILSKERAGHMGATAAVLGSFLTADPGSDVALSARRAIWSISLTKKLKNR